MVTDTRARPRQDYELYARPELFRLLRAVRLDALYQRASGDTVWARGQEGDDIAVLDLVGGFGVGILGHNHPALVDCVHESLRRNVPSHVQGSNREVAGRLCRKLSELVGASTGTSYVVTLTTTGTEAVEAAIKHAELERQQRLCTAILKSGEGTRNVLEIARTSTSTQDRISDLSAQVASHNARAQQRPSVFLAVTGAFHGKTTGSIQLTFNEELRLPFQQLGAQVIFVPPGDLEAINEALRRNTLELLSLALDDSHNVTLQSSQFINVAGFFAEPIQGEGGVRAIDPAFLKEVARLAHAHGFPLILDEIQTGCGRTGEFLASQADGIAADYYLLSKALGGGLAKISALLVDRVRYVERFGFLHTSTFAEDDLSCGISLAALDLIVGKDSDVLARVRRQGTRLLSGLHGLRSRYPGIVKDVRGKGLMIGFEFAQMSESPSPAIRLLAEQHHLGFVIAGYLLNVWQIRVLPTLSDRQTLRLQPSAFISNDQIDRVLAALSDVCRILQEARSDDLVSFLTEGQEEMEDSWPAFT